jgi:hypothetical protein
MPERGPATVAEARDTRVAVVFAVAAITAAALAAWATLLASSAQDDWQRAVRGEVRMSANVVNDTITAYEQVPLAEAIVEHKMTAEELLKQGAYFDQYAHPAVYTSWVIEHGQSKLTRNEEPWVGSDGVFDVQGRIAALRQRDSAAVPPSSLRARGDAIAHRGWLVGLAIVPAALGFLAAATARAFPRITRPALVGAVLLILAAIAVAVVAGVAL